jgi:sulfur transfer protein SufE/stress-induced morphogen
MKFTSKHLFLLGCLSSTLVLHQQVDAFSVISGNNVQRTATIKLSMVSSDSEIESLNLTPQLESMTKAFGSIPDEKTRYKQLLYMANQLQPMDESLMIPENKVPGCLSTVYVDCDASKNEDNELVLNYVGTSDGILTKGLVALLVRGLSGCTPEQIQKVDPEFINAAKITQSLTPGRNNGFLNMLAVMKKKAAQALEEEEGGASGDNGSEEVEEEDAGGVIKTFDEVEGKPMYNLMMESLLKLQPVKLNFDDSHQHAGHAGSKGWEESGESHFTLEIVAEAFSGMALVKRHQLIYLVLGDTMSKIHALQISAKAPDEV